MLECVALNHVMLYYTAWFDIRLHGITLHYVASHCILSLHVALHACMFTRSFTGTITMTITMAIAISAAAPITTTIIG